MTSRSLTCLALVAVSAAALPARALRAQDTTRTARRPAPADSARSGRSEPGERVYRVHPRDLVGADSDVCDDLCRRERRLDSLYGKDRERRPATPAAPARPRTRPDSAARRP